MAALMAAAASAGVAGGAHAASKKSVTKPITVVGAYVTDVTCLPLSGTPTNEIGTFEVTCEIGAIYTGAFRGHTKGTLKGTFDAAGNASGVFDETFYGQYVPDGSWGTWRDTGTFTLDGATQVLQGQGTISEGTCGFYGSSGIFTFGGTSTYGSYSAQWTRPVTAPSDPACAVGRVDL